MGSILFDGESKPSESNHENFSEERFTRPKMEMLIF
jgi:hypothetical protein